MIDYTQQYLSHGTSSTDRAVENSVYMNASGGYNQSMMKKN
jgi:hypothetical protein